MKRLCLLCTLPLFSRISAQSTTDLVSIFQSNVHSLFTSYTSVLGASSSIAGNPLPTSESNAATTFGQTSLFGSSISASTSVTSRSRTRSRESSGTSSLTVSSSSDSATVLTTSSATSISGASTSTTTSQSGSTAASTATSSATASGGSGHNHTLAIVLGTVLGALGLGLLILLILLLCRRRRKQSRTTATHGAAFSTSNEALTDRRAPMSHVPPAATTFGPRHSKPLDRRHNAGTPLMSERIFQDVPPANNYQHGNTGPFVPGLGDPRRSSGILSSGMRDGLGSYDRLQDGSGLNNHPYEDDHHTGSALAAGVGGAALGAAAVSHSRSHERLSRPRAPEERDVRPGFWDEPPPRSHHRSSNEAARRRSGSMPRDAFYGPQEHANSPFREGVTADTKAATGRTPTGAFSHDSARQSYERDRHPLLSTLRAPDQSYESHATPTSNIANRSTFTKPDSPYNSSALRMTGDDINPTNYTSTGPATGVAALRDSPHDRSPNRSYAQGDSHAPLPPALTIQTPNSRRDLPSQSARHAHSSDQGMQRGSTPYGSSFGSNNGRSSGTSNWPRTASSRYEYNRLGSPIADDLVSPVSPDDTGKGVGQGVSLSPGKANLVDVPRSRSVSPQEASGTLRPPAPVSPTSSMSRSPIGDNEAASKQPSGLVNAVQGHFGPNTNRGRNNPSQTQTPPYEDNPYSPSLETTRASTFSNNRNNNNNAAPNRPLSKPIARKPVPLSPYNNNVQSPTQLLTNLNSRRDNWWRDQEDEGWTDSYPTR